MNHWLETSKSNLIPLSQATTFSEALPEWFFTGIVFDYDGEEIECELCEHPDLAHHFEIRNKFTSNRLLVGSSCILKFSEIDVYDGSGRVVTDSSERKFYLEEALREKLTAVMLEPLRRLWLVDIDHRKEIEMKAKQLKSGAGISPQALLFLFLRMAVHQIPYSPSRYKVSLRSYQEQGELSFMTATDLHKIKPALSPAQLKKHARLFCPQSLPLG